MGLGPIPAFPTSYPQGPHQGLHPSLLQGPRVSSLLHTEPFQRRTPLMLQEFHAEEKEDTEREQYLDKTDGSECDDVEDYVSEEENCLRQEMKQKAKLLHSEDECEVLEGIEYFKKSLEQGHPEYSYLDDVTIIPQLVHLFSCNKDPKLHVSCKMVIQSLVLSNPMQLIYSFYRKHMYNS